MYRREKGDKASGEDLDDPYWAGKDMGRLARLALIADELGMHDEVRVDGGGRSRQQEGWGRGEGCGNRLRATH